MSARLYGLIPAAGSGTRLGSEQPKQYSQIHGEAMLIHAVRALLGHAAIETVFVVLHPDDASYAELDMSEFGDRVAPLYCGGAARRDSVRNGLLASREAVDPDDWVLVHDAARPCLGEKELHDLIKVLKVDDVGGILAIPLADTLKRSDSASRIEKTEPRENLWLAQTPQMFRHGTLLRALDAAPNATDEAGAVEVLGLKPKLVQGASSNLKVTYAGDIDIAAAILAHNKRNRA
ncbi:MAG TPA: 2-C-methyl-D-erythritol 4-phosphate cytidylyltransferase [Burkholderiales bacterium]|nr:2-C-methyl-D-erythritol 4-phosphate cytidylyltransferase [Burkholderiales bacterium]